LLHHHITNYAKKTANYSSDSNCQCAQSEYLTNFFGNTC